MNRKRTKIVATISDRHCETEFIRELFEAGMDVIRINSAHLEIEGAQMIMRNARAVSDKIPFLIDTKGPLHLENDQDAQLTLHGDPVKTNWSGLRIGISIGWCL